MAAVALVLGLTNLYYYTGASFFTEDRSGLVIEAASGEVDDFSALQALEEWNTAVKEGLSHVHTPTWILAQESAKIYRWRTIAFFTVGFSALLVAVGAVFLGRRR